MQDEEYDYLFKVVLVGDYGVGKRHLLSRYIKGTLPEHPRKSIGGDLSTRIVSLRSGVTVKAQIWDTSGQERYRAMPKAFYRNAVGALLVYDITKYLTFQNAKRWIEELRQHAGPDIVIILVGNMVDLTDRNEASRQVPIEIAKQFAEQNNLLFEETSAITTVGVQDAFNLLLQEIYNQMQRRGNGGTEAPITEFASRLAPNSNFKKPAGCCG